MKTSDVFQMDGAQDPKCNTGGILTTDDPDVHEKFMNEVVVYEGLHTYGGMAGRTMEVLARGIVEMCDEGEVHWVMHQTERFTQRLRDAGIPLERGCDGAYIRADEFLPHIAEHPQGTFSAALYLLSGVRAVATGLVGKDRLVPVQIPRLAMTNAQLDQVADAIVALWEQRDQVTGLQETRGGRLAGPDALPLGLSRTFDPSSSTPCRTRSTPSRGSGFSPGISASGRFGRRGTTRSCCAPPTSPSIS